MNVNRKESVLIIALIVLLGILVFETGIILYSMSTQSGKEGFLKLGFKQRAAKNETPPWSRYLAPEWNPFQEMIMLRERMNRMIDDMFNRGLANPLFQEFSQEFAFYEPEVDVTETEKEVIVRCDLPGLDKDKIEVEVKNNYITLRGARDMGSEMTEPAKGFFRKERRFGSFTKTFLLPVPVDETKSKASYKNGVLMVELAKLMSQAQEEKATKVAVA